MKENLKIKEESDNPVLNIALDTIRIGKQALIFANTKKSAEKTAEDISKKIKTGDGSLNKLSDEALNALEKPTKQCERLSLCLKKGIAFHHAGLVQKQRTLIEDNFKNGAIKIICSTPTLAYGVDTPAYRSIIKDLKRYGAHGLTWIPVLDYLQMSGRAGRPNYDTEGQSIALAGTVTEKEKIEEKYIYAEPEDIYSKLAVEPVLRTYVLSLTASGFSPTKKKLFEFFDKTFYAHQYKDLRKLHATLMKVIEMLKDWEFIISSADDFSDAGEIDDEKFRATVIGKRVAELYIDPLTAHHMIECLRNASDKKVHAFSFLQMVCHTLEMRPLIRVSFKDGEMIQQALIEFGDFLLESEPSMYEPEYAEFIDSIKTALMMNYWINEEDEVFMLENYNVRPGELKTKIDIADWLLYANEEICKIMHYQSLIKEIIKVRLRIKYGVKEELLALVRFENIGRARARILFRNRIKDIKDIRNTDIATLSQIIGEKTALSLKKQLGESQSIVPENKRKGQISLRDWE